MATQNVKQTIPLTADGLAQKYVSTSATNITKARIMNVYGQATAADAEIKIYNEIMALPLFPNISKKHQDSAIKVIKS